MRFPRPSREKGKANNPLYLGACGVGVLLLAGMGYMAIHQQGGKLHGPAPVSGGQEVQASPPVKLPFSKIVEVAKALDPELMAHAPSPNATTDAHYKNPCWRDGPDNALKCLPYVYVAGSFQSGAATLYQKLSEHPHVITTSLARWQFWGEDVKPMKEFVAEHSKEGVLKKLESDPKHMIILDGSSSTFAFYWSAGLRAHRAFQSVMVPCWRECSDEAHGNVTRRSECMEAKCHPRALAADEKVAQGLGVPYDAMHVPLIMQAAYGDKVSPKMIVLLRNPIDRLHCAYWQYAHYHGKYGKHAKGFLDYVHQQVDALKACAARFTGEPGGITGGPMSQSEAERHCALYFEALGPSEEQVFFHADQFIRGMYSIFLEVWLRHLPRENILVLKAEEYFAHPGKTMEQVFAFLGMEVPADPKVQKMIQSAGRPNSFTKNGEPMLPEARAILEDLYMPYNIALAQLLQDDKWLEYNQKPAAAAATGAAA